MSKSREFADFIGRSKTEKGRIILSNDAVDDTPVFVSNEQVSSSPTVWTEFWIANPIFGVGWTTSDYIHFNNTANSVAIITPNVIAAGTYKVTISIIYNTNDLTDLHVVITDDTMTNYYLDIPLSDKGFVLNSSAQQTISFFTNQLIGFRVGIYNTLSIAISNLSISVIPSTFTNMPLISFNDSAGNVKLNITVDKNPGNIFMGLNAGDHNIDGDYNIALGSESLSNLSLGNNNIAIGYNSLHTVLDDNHIGIGINALSSYTKDTASLGPCIAIGTDALRYNTVGGNIAIGAFSQSNTPLAITPGNFGNISIGNYALHSNVNGQFSIAIGNDALRVMAGNNDGNVAIGDSAMASFIGAQPSVAIGRKVLNQLQYGSNVAVGVEAGRYMTGANGSQATQNTLLGNFAGNGISTGNRNIVIGYSTGSQSSLLLGNDNTIIGSTLTNWSGTLNNNIIIAAGSAIKAQYNGTSWSFTGAVNASSGLVGNLTGKVNPSVTSITSNATITPNADTTDTVTVTALAVSASIEAPTGTPMDCQRLLIKIKDNGTAQTLSWVTSTGGYRAIGVTLPTTTIAGKKMYIGCVYDSDGYWDVIAVGQQG